MISLYFLISEWATGIPPRMMWDGIAPGTWLIFGVVLFPVYAALTGWFIGYPRDPAKAAMGVVYLVVLTLGLWIPALIGTIIIGLLFF